MIKKTRKTIQNTPYVLKELKRVIWRSMLSCLSTHLSAGGWTEKIPVSEKVNCELRYD